MKKYIEFRLSDSRKCCAVADLSISGNFVIVSLPQEYSYLAAHIAVEYDAVYYCIEDKTVKLSTESQNIMAIGNSNDSEFNLKVEELH